MHTIQEEMQQMGEFILLSAQASAEENGIESDGIIRNGKVRDELISLCHELKTDYLVLGQPKIEREDSLFSQEMLKQFVERTERETGARVILADNENE